jgi:hypothetical protein
LRRIFASTPVLALSGKTRIVLWIGMAGVISSEAAASRATAAAQIGQQGEGNSAAQRRSFDTGPDNGGLRRLKVTTECGRAVAHAGTCPPPDATTHIGNGHLDKGSCPSPQPERSVAGTRTCRGGCVLADTTRPAQDAPISAGTITASINSESSDAIVRCSSKIS